MRTVRYRKTKSACYLGYIIQAVVNNLTSLLFVVFNEYPYNVSQEELGRLIFINFVTQLTIDALSIYIVPKLGYRKCVVLAQLCSGVGFVLLGVLPTIMPVYLGLIIAIMCLAVGSGFIEVLISPIMEALPNDNKAGNMSFLHSFYCWGQVLTVAVSTLILLDVGRNKWFVLPIIWSVLPFINTVIFSKVPILELEGDKNHSFSLRAVLKQKSFYLCLALMFCAGASELAMVQWSSFFVEVGFSIDKWVGDLLGPCMFAVFMGIGRVCFAVFGKKLPIKPTIMCCSALCTACYFAVAFSNVPVITIAGCAICGISVSVMWPGVFSLAAERFKGSGSSLFGLLAMFGDLGCAVGPWLLSIVSEYSTKTGAVVFYAETLGIHSAEPGMQFGFLVTAAIPLFMFLVLLVSLVFKTKKSNQHTQARF